MTQMTQPLTIPAEGLTTEIGARVITVTPHPHAGYLLRVRDNGRIVSELCGQFNHEWDAKQAYAKVVEAITPEPTPTAPAVRLAPVAKGTATKVSDPAHTALAVAAINGHIARGGQLGQASITLINSLARRGYLARTTEMHGLRQVITGGTITGAGRIRLAELTAADREAAEHAARLARALSITIAA